MDGSSAQRSRYLRRKEDKRWRESWIGDREKEPSGIADGRFSRGSLSVARPIPIKSSFPAAAAALSARKCKRKEFIDLEPTTSVFRIARSILRSYNNSFLTSKS